MDDTAKSKTAHKTIIDVAHPDHSAPSDTSIPIIVNNRPILRDPMMANDIPTVGKVDNETSSSLLQTSGKIITPSVSDDKTDQIDSRVETVPEAISEPETISTEQSENSILADTQTDSKPPQDKINAELEMQAKHEAELNALVENKDYFLPINTTTQQRTKRFVIIGVGVSLLLVIVWVDIALDAGLIKIGGLKALTHIFST